MPSGEAATARRRLPTHLHDPISIVLVVIVLIGALVPWLGIAQAWTLTGDPEFRSGGGQEVSRWLFVAEVLQYWPLQPGDGSGVLAMAAALALIVLCGPAGAGDAALGQRRVALSLALLGMAVALLAPLLRLILVLYAMTSTPDELSGVYLTDRGGLTDVQSLLGLGAEVLAWSMLLLLGMAWWPRGETAFADDDGGAADGVGGVDVGDRNTGEREASAEVVSVEQWRPSSSPDPGPGKRVDPTRLRADGSSDSGFDEFHFRR